MEKRTKAIYELQMEICRQALNQIKGLKKLSLQEKNLLKMKITSDLTRMKRTKRPIPSYTPPLGKWDIYTKEHADKIRETLKGEP
jgi:hypothetical protein